MRAIILGRRLFDGRLFLGGGLRHGRLLGDGRIICRAVEHGLVWRAWPLRVDVRQHRLLEVAAGLAVNGLPQAPPEELLIARPDPPDVRLGVPAEHTRRRLLVRAEAREGVVQDRSVVRQPVLNTRDERALHVAAHVFDRVGEGLPIRPLVGLRYEPHLLLRGGHHDLEDHGLVHVAATEARGMQLVGLSFGQALVGEALLPLRLQATEQEGRVEPARVALDPLLHALALALSEDRLGRLEFLVGPRATQLAEQRVVRAEALHALNQQFRIQLSRRGHRALHEVLEAALEHAAELAVSHLPQRLAVTLGVDLVDACELRLGQRAQDADQLVLVRAPAFHRLVHRVRVSLGAELQHAVVIHDVLTDEVVLVAHIARVVVVHRLGALNGREVLLRLLLDAGDRVLQRLDHLLRRCRVFWVRRIQQRSVVLLGLGPVAVQVIVVAWREEVLVHIEQLQRPMELRAAEELGLLVVEVLLEVRTEAAGGDLGLGLIGGLRVPVALRWKALEQMDDAIEE
mmetsp:Transcript_104277/g.301682  ORF Transcript_104277/g.301682 Transcript_104277/m.301682 type:complete len:514 (-) Transcript_104277:1284-2825(-)